MYVGIEATKDMDIRYIKAAMDFLDAKLREAQMRFTGL